MKLYFSASAYVLALSIGTATGVAVAQPNSNASAHDKTVAAATRAHDTGVAAADAMCKPDKAVQTRTRQAADTAAKALDAAAQEEADRDPQVSQTHIAAIQAGLAENGNHPGDEGAKLAADTKAKMDAYQAMKDIKANQIREAALQAVSTAPKAACPPATQRAAAPPPPPPPIPPLPATPEKATAMLRTFNDPLFKASLAQPGLRVRVETLMGLEGCDWRVNANASGQPTSRNAAAFLSKLNDSDLRTTLSNPAVQDRIDAAFGRSPCSYTPQQEQLGGFPAPNSKPDQDQGPYPYGYPGGYDNNPRNGPSPVPIPGVPYGGYGNPYGYPYNW